MAFKLNKKISEISSSRGERMKWLLKNPEFGRNNIGNIVDCDKQFPVRPNCYGTVAYVCGINYCEFNLKGFGPRPFALPSKGGPGFLDGSLFSSIIKKNCEIIRVPSPGDIVTFHTDSRGEYNWSSDGLVHAAIYINNASIDTINIFEQDNFAGIFRVRKTSFKKERVENELKYYRTRK